MTDVVGCATARAGFTSRELRSASEAGVRPTGLIAASRHARVLSADADDGPAVLKVAAETTMADPIGRARLAREGRVGLALSHPNLVRTLRCGEDWILLEDCGAARSGAPSLLERVRGTGPLDATEVEARIAAIAGALAHMHARGFVHRDVKPGNILTGADQRSVLIDFGAVGLAAHDELDGTELIGSPAWMAPEQIRGGGAHASADVWSLAMVAVFALGGAKAYEGTASEVLRRRQVEAGAEAGAAHALVERVLPIASGALRDLIVSTLSDDARSRPPARAFAQLG